MKYPSLVVSYVKIGGTIVTKRKLFKRKGIKFWCYYFSMRLKSLMVMVLQGERNGKNRNS